MTTIACSGSSRRDSAIDLPDAERARDGPVRATQGNEDAGGDDDKQNEGRKEAKNNNGGGNNGGGNDGNKGKKDDRGKGRD